MAAITPDTATAEQATGSFLNSAGHSLAGFKHLTLPFITQLVDNLDTYTPGGEVSIIRAAWEPEGTDDTIAVNIGTDADGVIFLGADNSTGYLHLWVSN